MKSVFSIVFLVGTLLVQAQIVQDFKYIIVPNSFESFENDKFHLGAVFKQIVDKKNYEAIPENSAYWPTSVHTNKCQALVVDFEKKSNWRKNILNVHFKTCDGSIIESFTGESTIKEYKEGYQDALRIALKNLKVSNAKQIDLEYIPAPKSPEIKDDKKVEVVSTHSTPAPSLNIGTEFKNGNTIVQLTELKDGSLALIEKSSNTVIALMKPTSKKGVYQATVTDGNNQYTTVGYYDGETIGIDYLNSSKEFELKEFKKVQ